MSPSAGAELGEMLFYTLQRLDCHKCEDSRGTVISAAVGGCVIQVGREREPDNCLLREAQEPPWWVWAGERGTIQDISFYSSV